MSRGCVESQLGVHTSAPSFSLPLATPFQERNPLQFRHVMHLNSRHTRRTGEAVVNSHIYTYLPSACSPPFPALPPPLALQGLNLFSLSLSLPPPLSRLPPSPPLQEHNPFELRHVTHLHSKHTQTQLGRRW